MSCRLLLLLQVQEAYETLIKRRGQPKDAQPQGQDSWNFHDWCGLFQPPPGHVCQCDGGLRFEPLMQREDPGSASGVLQALALQDVEGLGGAAPQAGGYQPLRQHAAR